MPGRLWRWLWPLAGPSRPSPVPTATHGHPRARTGCVRRLRCGARVPSAPAAALCGALLVGYLRSRDSCGLSLTLVPLTVVSQSSAESHDASCQPPKQAQLDRASEDQRRWIAQGEPACMRRGRQGLVVGIQGRGGGVGAGAATRPPREVAAIAPLLALDGSPRPDRSGSLPAWVACESCSAGCRG